MKIAVVTDDGTTICQHFGQAQYYSVITIENGKVTSKEQRSKAGHHVAGAQHASHASHGEKHGFDANAQASHAGMMANITDCQLVMAGGMGWGAQVSLKQAGIDVYMTDKINIDEAIQLYIQGKLPNLQERLH
jgi:predicted Fe-Mo cluster-binding NifX family protein